MKRRTQGSSPVRAIGALSAIAALTMTGMVAVPALAAPGDGTLTVEVNRDFSGDGLYEPAFDPGQEGIDVTLTDGTTTVGPLTTNADGQVAFDLSTLAGSKFRVDVSIPATAPDYLEFAPASASGAADAFRSATTFVDGTTQTIHVGVWNPNTYVTRNPKIAIAQQKQRGTSPDFRSLMVTDWDNRGPLASSFNDNTTGIDQVASQAETGSVFGLAWDYRTDSLFSAAYAKAYTVYGPGGSGAIYRTDASAGGVTGNTVHWATIPNAGSSVHQNIAGRDDAFFLAAGSEGLGGLALSDDGATLYTVNLNDKTLYSLNTGDSSPATAAPVAVITDPGCVGGEWRPFAVTQRDGEVYVGGICDASASLARADLSVHILRLDGSSFTEIYSHGLDFIRGNETYPDPVPNYTDPEVGLHWNPWRTAWDADLIAYNAAGSRQYGMPLLTSFAFENDGSIVLSLRDRKVDAIVAQGYGPDGVSPTANHQSFGDINKVCLTDGVYEWEGSGACPNNATPANSGQPADRVEFFPGDRMYLPIHTETSLGAVLISPREPDLINTSMNPTNLVATNGLGFFDREAGTGPGNDWENNGLLIAGNNFSNFGKGSGLGGVSLLASPAPIQIGNYVWFDQDHDGEQDADEASIAGVTVKIYAADGTTLLGTTTTNENGEYYFGGEGGLALEPGVDYVIEFDLATADTSTLPGSPTTSDLSYTKVQEPGAGSTHDSNPTPQANPLIGRTTVTAPDHAGGVDHTIDAGVYYTLPGIDIVKFDGRQTPPTNPVDGPDAPDGAYAGPTTGSWDPAVDADTEAAAVEYPLTDGSTGAQPVHMIVTNTGNVALSDVTVKDTTLQGPAITGLTCDFSPLGGPATGVTWAGPLAAGASFVCSGSLAMGPEQVHEDVASVQGQPLDVDGAPSGEVIGDEDQYWATTPADTRVPGIDIVKFDGRQLPPLNPVDGPDAVDGAYGGPTTGDWSAVADADTQADAVQYPITDGSTGAQPVHMIVTNTGEVPLGDVSVADLTLQGTTLTGLSCDFSALGGPASGTTWSGPFAAGDSFSCVATLTMGASEVHNDIASVTGQPLDFEGEPTGEPVGDEDGYWAETPADERAPAIDIVKFDGRQTAPANPVDGPDVVDGTYSGPTPGDWDGAVDADTQADAVQYPLTDGVTGPQPVGMIVTNTGNMSIVDVAVSDLTLDGPALTGITCDFSPLGGPASATTWDGAFLAGDSFSCTGTLAMGASAVHNDIASVSGQPVGTTGEPFGPTVGDEDAYWAETPADERAPAIDIVKFDGRQTAPANPVDGPDAIDGASGGPTAGDWDAAVDADTQADAVEYPLTAGTSGPQPVSMIITNTGNVSLADVAVADLTLQGSALTGVSCDFSPLGGPATGTSWSGPFLAGDSFSCTGTLTMGASEVHNDIASVTGQPIDGNGEPFGSTVGDEDGYWATTPADTRVPSIDIVKFDGRQSAPENPVDGPDAVDGEYGGPTTGDWDAAIDADTQEDAVQYPIADSTTGPQPVGFIVTNTGQLALTGVSVSDLTKLGSDVTGLTCDFSPLGGPATGTSWDGPFQPGDSFSCSATLTMGAAEVHNDIASVSGQPVGNDGEPVGPPVGDEDGYWAETPQSPSPSLEITKRQAETGDEADTAADAIDAAAGEAVQVEMPVTNTGNTPLTEVVVSDHTDDGPAMTEFACEFPDGTTVSAVDGAVRWAATFTDPATASWQPGVTFTCTGVVTLGADETHADTVTVTAVTPDGATLTDDNPFHVKTPPVEPTPTPTATPTSTPTATPTTPAPTTSAPSTPVPTISVATPGVPNLPSTGAAISTGVIAFGTLLLGLGLVVMLARRRSTQR
ncbi:SdrD B-like domain-containing protein [Microbacterium sp. ZW T5_56]|uniref:SdrD B-like domain-containing protein n=1 Tax=Microbacterium sp. ZW T5_56 TaxID=3378081 RepID=UPI0038543064